MASTQVLKIKILNCGGLWDLMSEKESLFLSDSLGLFRNVEDVGRSRPRANVNLERAYSKGDFWDRIFGEPDILHLISHGTGAQLQAGATGAHVSAI